MAVEEMQIEEMGVASKGMAWWKKTSVPFHWEDEESNILFASVCNHSSGS